MGGGWRSRCRCVGGGDARLGGAVWQWFSGPEPLLLLWCLSRAWLSHCARHTETSPVGLFINESRMAASSFVGGGLREPTGPRINDPALFPETQGVCVL